jgi:IPT/TIG domain
MPKDAEATIAIGNFGNSRVKARATFSNGDTEEMEIPPLGTHLIERQSKTTSDVDGVTLQTLGSNTDLIATGTVTSRARNFTSSIRFYDTQFVAQPNLYATNFRLKAVTPRLLLRNTGSETISATPRFIPAAGDPNNFIDLPSVTLNPNQIVDVDVEPLRAATLGKSEFDHVSIQVLNDGAPGSLIGALNGIDSRLAYDVPLRDIGGMRNSTGAYPWRVDQDVSTIVSLTNTGTVSSGVLVLIRYPGGTYQVDPRPLAAGETVFYDLREIRDKQIPDRDGRTIPRSVKGGQFKWSLYSYGPGSGRIIGRAEMISESQGISSSYSCPGGNCPMEFSYAFVSPENLYLSEGDAAASSVFEVWCDAWGCTGPFGANVNEWDNSNPLVAPLIANGNVANFVAIDGGETTFSAEIAHDRWGWDGLNCYWLGWFYDSTQGTVRVLEMDSITPSRGVVSATTSVAITGKMFIDNATLVIEGSGVTASNVTVVSETLIVADLVVAHNAEAGNHLVKVRINNRNSNGKNFFVQVPTHIVPFNHALAPGGIGPLKAPVNQPIETLTGVPVGLPVCGVYRHYLFFLTDQANQEIVNRPFTVGEIFTNYSGSFSTPTFTPFVIGPGQVIGDIHFRGFAGSDCLHTNQNEQFDQQFTVTFGGHTYTPVTRIHISRGNFNGELKVDRTITTP